MCSKIFDRFRRHVFMCFYRADTDLLTKTSYILRCFYSNKLNSELLIISEWVTSNIFESIGIVVEQLRR